MLHYISKLNTIKEKLVNNLLSRFGSIDGINAKSTAMSPTLWMFGIAFSGTALLYWITKLNIVIYIGLVFIAVVGIAALGLNIFFAIKDPDRLQSEKFIERKIAIERGIIGDSQMGLSHKSKAIEASCDVKDNNND